MSDKMSFLLFGDQSLDTHVFLAEFCRRSQPGLLSSAFLKHVSTALQNEIDGLSAIDRQYLPDFSSIEELNRRYYENEYRTSSIDSALLVTTQLAHYIE